MTRIQWQDPGGKEVRVRNKEDRTGGLRSSCTDVSYTR